MIRTPFLAGKKVAVVGLGKSGTATAHALAASGAVPLLWDDQEAKRAEAQGLGFQVADPITIMAELALVVWSPGIPHTFPRRHPIADAARANNIPLVCDVELLALARPDCRFVGITGTNGKSTTTTLLAHILKSAGVPSTAGGNLGIAALDLEELPAGGVYVLELSSYQLELAPSLRLDASILLNITPDHLARHGGMAGYIAAKRNLLVQTRGTAVIGVDDEACATLYAEFKDQITCLPLSVTRRLEKGISAPDSLLLTNSRPVMGLNGIATLPGRHNRQNACAAFAATRALGLDEQTIAEAIRSYPGLAHRQELVATLGGILYVNDSKATNADATEKALVCYEPIYWILGGQAKEGGIQSLLPYFQRIRHAFLIGEAAEQFAATLAGKVPFTHCVTLDIATAAAHRQAQAERVAGAAVLLSPACASWDQFKSFEHRGEVFRALVEGLARGRRA